MNTWIDTTKALLSEHDKASGTVKRCETATLVMQYTLDNFDFMITYDRFVKVVVDKIEVIASDPKCSDDLRKVCLVLLGRLSKYRFADTTDLNMRIRYLSIKYGLARATRSGKTY